MAGSFVYTVRCPARHVPHVAQLLRQRADDLRQEYERRFPGELEAVGEIEQHPRSILIHLHGEVRVNLISMILEPWLTGTDAELPWWG